MDNNKNILILNTGGTFNKVYHEIDGKLVVPSNNKSIKTILKSAKSYQCKLKGIVFKDSLEITCKDRLLIKNYILKSKFKKIIIVHGTDTISQTAQYLSKYIKDRIIILTGSMIPFSIDPIEATSNLMLSLGAIKEKKKNNIYIVMHGHIKKYTKIKKNRKLGVFECQK